MQKGTLLVELLVAAAVLGTILMATVTALGFSYEGIASEKLQNNAQFLLQEELDPLLTIRDKGWVDDGTWNSISKNGTYYVAPLGNSWQLVATTSGEMIGQFTRKVTISDVNRDSDGQIIANGGTVDPSTKKAVATVSWNTIIPHQISATTYITRYKDNLTWVQTTQAEFNAGTKNGVAVTNTSGGEVILGAGGQGDWCKPQPIVGQVDLDKSGVANAISAIPLRVFAGTGENASGPSFDNVTISDPADPKQPIGTVAGSLDGYKTNGIFGETNYAYLATDTNSKEIVIIDLTQNVNGKYVEAGYFNAPGNGSGNSIFVVGNTGYMTSGNKLYNFTLSANRSGSQAIKDPDGVTLAGTGNKIVVVGNYAYVATSSTTNQLQIVDIATDPNNVTIIGSLGLNDKGAMDLFVNSSASRAYVVTANSAANPEFYIIDITTKTNPKKVAGGSYDTGEMSPKGVTVVTGGRALVVGTGGKEYQTVDISVETNPTQCIANGGMDVDSGINGIASVIEADNDAYSYIITGDSTSELKMILGGPGGQFATSGTFESSTFNSAYQTAFNRFTATFNKPGQTDIQFQIAGADVGTDGTCTTATFTFVGPDGTSGSFFTTTSSPLTAAIPLSPGPGYKNSARCFRYRAYLTTSDATQTPALYDFTVNYSP